MTIPLYLLTTIYILDLLSTHLLAIAHCCCYHKPVFYLISGTSLGFVGRGVANFTLFCQGASFYLLALFLPAHSVLNCSISACYHCLAEVLILFAQLPKGLLTRGLASKFALSWLAFQHFSPHPFYTRSQS